MLHRMSFAIALGVCALFGFASTASASPGDRVHPSPLFLTREAFHHLDLRVPGEEIPYSLMLRPLVNPLFDQAGRPEVTTLLEGRFLCSVGFVHDHRVETRDPWVVVSDRRSRRIVATLEQDDTDVDLAEWLTQLTEGSLPVRRPRPSDLPGVVLDLIGFVYRVERDVLDLIDWGRTQEAALYLVDASELLRHVFNGWIVIDMLAERWADLLAVEPVRAGGFLDGLLERLADDLLAYPPDTAFAFDPGRDQTDVLMLASFAPLVERFDLLLEVLLRDPDPGSDGPSDAERVELVRAHTEWLNALVGQRTFEALVTAERWDDALRVAGPLEAFHARRLSTADFLEGVKPRDDRDEPYLMEWKESWERERLDEISEPVLRVALVTGHLDEASAILATLREQRGDDGVDLARRLGRELLEADRDAWQTESWRALAEWVDALDD